MYRATCREPGCATRRSRLAVHLAVSSDSVLQLGDSVAAARGARVNATRTALFCLTALLTAAVSAVEAVGFLGLVAQHVARWLTGEDAWLLRPETGAVLLDGTAMDRMSPCQVARQIATLPQSPCGPCRSAYGAGRRGDNDGTDAGFTRPAP